MKNLCQTEPARFCLLRTLYGRDLRPAYSVGWPLDGYFDHIDEILEVPREVSVEIPAGSFMALVGASRGAGAGAGGGSVIDFLK